MVSISVMPAVNSAGNTRIDQIGSPLDACVAAMARRPISVAVSKPSPNRKPSGYMCQLLPIIAEQPAENAREEAAAVPACIRSSAT